MDELADGCMDEHIEGRIDEHNEANTGERKEAAKLYLLLIYYYLLQLFALLEK